MTDPGSKPWFSEEEVDYYAEFLAGPSAESHRNFKTLLATVSEVLGQTDLESLLKKLVEHSLETTRSERGILMLESDGALKVRVALDREGRSLGIDPPLARSVAETVFREGQPIIRSVTQQHQVLDMSQSAATLRLRQVMCAPLRARGRRIGAIYVDSTLSGPPHTESDLNLFHAQAGLIGMAVENHRLFEEAFNARDMQRQLAVARDIQQRLFPHLPMQVAGVDFAGVSVISSQVGGDYFDYVPLEDGRVGIGIGDVSGHGIAPALIMSDVRARLRSLLQTQRFLGGLYGMMNVALCSELAEGMYVALFVAVYDRKTRVLEYQNGGHVPPLLYRAETGDLVEIIPNAPVLGLFEDQSAGPCPKLEVGAGDFLICYTDGVTDRPNREGDLYGEDRLREVVLRCARDGADATAMARAIRADSDVHADGRPDRDDFSLLVARF